MRRLYPPLIGALLIVLVVGLINRGGGNSSKQAATRASAPQSVFPAPSKVPAPAPPPVVVPTQTTPPTPPAPSAPPVKQQALAAQPKHCRPLQVNGRAVSVTILQGQVKM